MNVEENIEELFKMVYSWGRAGVVVDHTSPVYQTVVRDLLKQAYENGHDDGVGLSRPE